MMGSYLKKYDVELLTIGPVFIGSGETVNKKEAIFGKSKVTIVDANKMLDYMLKRNMLKRYQDYMLDPYKDLSTFLKENNIGNNVYEKWESKEFSLGDTTNGGEVKQRGIERFVRDGRGKVYVPGSSLKGMLRTILTGAYIIENAYNAVGDKLNKTLDALGYDIRAKQLDKSFKKVMDEIDIKLFHRNLFSNPEFKEHDKINDSLRGLMISDSEYISDEDICVCQKVDMAVDGTEVALPLYRECIKPGVSIKFTVTVDSSLCKYDKKSIIDAIAAFYTNYWEKISKQFNKAPRSNKKHTCFLGGGSGFPDKTVIYSSFDKNDAVEFTSEILRVMFPKAKHENDTTVSPRMIKCTKYDNKTFLFGACILDKFSEYEIDFA